MALDSSPLGLGLLTAHGQEQLARPEYRPDIDGLRALAVLSVVLFHANPKWVPGGFIGVDIFFVISGYLITTIITNNLAKGSFGFAEFYRRRVRRIFPALLVVLAASLVAGSLLMTANEYELLGKHIAGGAGFYSNFLFWMESGYFDQASDMKPMLHLWSLSIEEQFYVLWPLLLWFVYSKKRSALAATAVIAGLSFVLNIYYAQADSAAAFYSPLSRSWELLAGGMLAHFGQRRAGQTVTLPHGLANVISFSGTALLLAGLVLINEDRSFPGWWAVLPVLGTVLMILAGPRAWVNRVILSGSVWVWFGLISYPLYLTHWPILSFLRILESGEISNGLRLLAIAVSIALAWLIFIFIEKPIRFGAYSRLKISALAGSMVLLGCSGFYIHAKQGNALRINTPPREVVQGEIGHQAFFEYMETHFHPCTPARIRREMETWEGFIRCYQSKEQHQKQVAIIGDSHAEHSFIGLAEELPELNVVYYIQRGVPFLTNDKFAEIYSYVVEDKGIKAVIVSAKWARELAAFDPQQTASEFDRLISALTAANKAVYLLADVPQFDFGPGKCKYTGRLGQESTCRQDADSIARQEESYYPDFIRLSERYPDLMIINASDFFCDKTWCHMARDGNLYYRDSHHLGVHGSQSLWRHISEHSPAFEDIKLLSPP